MRIRRGPDPANLRGPPSVSAGGASGPVDALAYAAPFREPTQSRLNESRLGLNFSPSQYTLTTVL